MSEDERDELLELVRARPFRGLVWSSGWYAVTRDEDGIDQVLDGPYETREEAQAEAWALTDRRERECFPRLLKLGEGQA